MFVPLLTALPVLLAGAGTLALGSIETGNAVVPNRSYELGDIRLRFGTERLRLLTGAVHFQYLPHFFGIKGIKVGIGVTVVREVHNLPEDVGLAQICQTVLKLQRTLDARNARLGVEIIGHLVIEAALKLAALPRQFLRVKRKILAACRRGGYALERCDIVGAAKFPSAHSQAAYETGLLTGAYLLHLYADL